MQIPLNANEKIMFSLRSLYGSYGYTHYKMSKFEEYDLYSKNKDFLVSEGVITFTDTNGKLMALKPDVTLSIIKNTNDSCNAVQKLYYNENVYRVSKSLHSFKEIMQVGLECMGNVDDFCIFEVLTLAVKSLLSVSERSVLDISHLGILLQVVEYAGVPDEDKAEVFRCIGEKNIHELVKICTDAGVEDEKITKLKELVSLHGTPSDVMPKLTGLFGDMVDAETLSQFGKIISALGAYESLINIDFSVVDDFHYYNGIVFKGFVEGVPNSVLSGGQYDKLMKKMKRRDKAIGFAVYLDMLEQLGINSDEYDVDCVLLYDDSTAFDKVEKLAEEGRETGRVLIAREIPENIRYRYIARIENGEVKSDEDNA